MIAAGWSPSVRLFEAAACGVAIVSDVWPGLEEFFVPGREILIAASADDVTRYLSELPAAEAAAIGAAARQRILIEHTAAHRARARPPPILSAAAPHSPDEPRPLHGPVPAKPPRASPRRPSISNPGFTTSIRPTVRRPRPIIRWATFPRSNGSRSPGACSDDLNGWTALDIGCNAGFYSVELARRGAHVTAIDKDPHFLRQAQWVIEQFHLQDRIDLHQGQVYDLAHWRRDFDLILFMGVFYHLRYPLHALDIVAAKTRKLLVFQTLTTPGEAIAPAPEDLGLDERDRLSEPAWSKMAFIEKSLAGDPTNWWAPNHACIEAMLRTSGLRVMQRPGHEILLVALARIAAIFLGGVIVIRGEMTVGTLLAFLGYVGGLFGPVQGLTGIYQTIKKASVSLDEIFAILDVQEHLGDATRCGGDQRRHGAGGIRPGEFSLRTNRAPVADRRGAGPDDRDRRPCRKRSSV